MRPAPVLLCLAALPALAQSAFPLAWGPALYTLRATDKTGAALVLLDEKGQETVIDRDDRTAGGGGFMSTVNYHATFYGTFSATPDLKTVVFTRHGKVKAPFSFGIGGFSGDTGGGFGYTAAFGEHDLDGIFAWDRATGKVARIWDQDGLISQLKAWVRTPEGAVFAEVDLKDEVRAHRPATMFHLAGSRFVWVNGGTAFGLDVGTKTARILFSDLDKGRVAGGGWSKEIAESMARPGDPLLPAGSRPGPTAGNQTFLAFSQRPALSSASQNADGSLTITRPGLLITVPVEGPVRVSPLGEGHRVVWTGPEGVAIGNGESVRTLSTRTPDPVTTASAKVDNSLLQPASDGKSIFVYKHYKTKDDTLSKVTQDGKVVWTAAFGDCRFGFLLAEAGDRVHVLVRKSGGDIPFRVVLQAATGAQVSQEPWLPGSVLEKTLGVYPAPVELADRAVLIPCAEGFLVWAPSRGEVEGLPAGTWTRDASAIPQLSADKAVDGQWCLLTPQLWLKPLASRPLADQMAVLSHGRMQPVMNWINHGIGQTSNPGDRILSSMNKKPLPFFIRDFGFWPSPTLGEFGTRMIPGESAAPVPTPATAPASTTPAPPPAAAPAPTATAPR